MQCRSIHSFFRFFKTSDAIVVFLIAMIFSKNILHGDAISVSGSPAAFSITTATAGQNPAAVTNTSTTYTATTTSTGRTITGNLNSAMPTGITLQIQLTAPSGGGTSAGSVTLTATAQNLVTGIPVITVGSAAQIKYVLTATVSAAQVTGGTRTVTLTIN